MFKKTSLLIFLFIGLLISGQSQDMRVYFHVNKFYSPESGNYVETYLAIDGKSIEYKKNDDKKFQGNIEITLIFYRDTAIYLFDKYILKSPEVDHIKDIAFNIIDLKRKQLEAGAYELVMKVVDLNNKKNSTTISQVIIIDHNRFSIQISDIALIESYTKTTSSNIYTRNGYDLIPLVTNFLATQYNQLIFYAEIYNTDIIFGKDEFLVSTTVRNKSNNKKINYLSNFTKQSPQPVNVIFSEFNISQLQSGNYYLEIEVRNQKNEIKAKKSLFFQRSNKNVDLQVEDIDQVMINNSFVKNFTIQELRYCLSTLTPISTGAEAKDIEYLLSKNDTTKMKQFFLGFWRNRNPHEPYQAWLTYGKEVEKVNAAYNTPINEGFETDRGRIYLKYGPPNRIFKEDRSPNKIPCQIWHYNQLSNGQREIKFVFTNQDLVTNNYRLVHSNALGEVNNPRWSDITHYENEGDLNTTDPFNRDLESPLLKVH